MSSVRIIALLCSILIVEINQAQSHNRQSNDYLFFDLTYGVIPNCTNSSWRFWTGYDQGDLIIPNITQIVEGRRANLTVRFNREYAVCAALKQFNRELTALIIKFDDQEINIPTRIGTLLSTERYTVSLPPWNSQLCLRGGTPITVEVAEGAFCRIRPTARSSYGKLRPFPQKWYDTRGGTAVTFQKVTPEQRTLEVLTSQIVHTTVKNIITSPPEVMIPDGWGPWQSGRCNNCQEPQYRVCQNNCLKAHAVFMGIYLQNRSVNCCEDYCVDKGLDCTNLPFYKCHGRERVCPFECDPSCITHFTGTQANSAVKPLSLLILYLAPGLFKFVVFPLMTDAAPLRYKNGCVLHELIYDCGLFFFVCSSFCMIIWMIVGFAEMKKRILILTLLITPTKAERINFVLDTLTQERIHLNSTIVVGVEDIALELRADEQYFTCETKVLIKNVNWKCCTVIASDIHCPLSPTLTDWFFLNTSPFENWGWKCKEFYNVFEKGGIGSANGCICNSNTYVFEGFVGPADNCKEDHAEILRIRSVGLRGKLKMKMDSKTIILNFNGMVKNTYNLTKHFGYEVTIEVGPFSYVPQITPTLVTYWNQTIINNNPPSYGVAGPGVLGDLAFSNFLLLDVYANTGFELLRPKGDASQYGQTPYRIERSGYLEFKKDPHFSDSPLPFGCRAPLQENLNQLKLVECHTGNLPILIQTQNILAKQKAPQAVISIEKIKCGGYRNYVAGFITSFYIKVIKEGLCLIEYPIAVVNYRFIINDTRSIIVHFTLFAANDLETITFKLCNVNITAQCETTDGRSHSRHGIEVHNLTSPDIIDHTDNVIVNFDPFGLGNWVWNVLVILGIVAVAVFILIMLCKCLQKNRSFMVNVVDAPLNGIELQTAQCRLQDLINELE